jgi:hypothetical protein
VSFFKGRADMVVQNFEGNITVSAEELKLFCNFMHTNPPYGWLVVTYSILYLGEIDRRQVFFHSTNS